MEGTRKLLFEHVLALWHRTLQHRPLNPTELAALLFLAGLEDVPSPVALRLPRRSWIWQIMANLIETSLPREPILRWAESHMAEMCLTFGFEDHPQFTAGNVGRIIFRFRKHVIRGE